MDRSYDVANFISKYFYFKKVYSFIDIIKITVMFIERTFKDSQKLKRVINCVLTHILP